MDDLISRAAAIAQIKENYCHWCDHIDLCQSCETQDCIATIEQQVPAVDAVPVVHARWKVVGLHRGLRVMECSNCRKPAYGATIFGVATFCPNCGAKMNGERREGESDG